ncbi:Uncharacterized conserved protein PhnB, glyoxalase superfamily [Paramicrobacterium humi]|uniref:Uncharacterized conserved protein PhnB, glyoxalase superfamily n=1 Tax=Paramicrobacterium humi TaxID=640635 RepID=A0A1H4M375_9MICO|nr:VOC family protein [Microbacterium humi]SEB77489.1 Uncharacterized conserved protein PhnB, glyoxalase superfamily [Microbacterium humi]
MSESLSHLSAITLFVSDLPRSKQFYVNTFEADVVFEDDTSSCVQFDNVLLNLLSARAADDLISGTAVGRRGTPVQFSVWVEDVDAARATLRERGVPVSEPIDRPWGKRTADLEDPDGIAWEIAQDIAPAE